MTTVQDGIRRGALDLGVPAGGACDPWSLALANRLLGNEPTAAALEMTLAGASLRAVTDCAVALAGAEMGASVEPAGEPLPSGASTVLRAGQTLRLGPAEEGSGVRAYLALSGGVDVPVVLGSRSTCLVGRFGGLDGRALREGDVVRPARPLAAADSAHARRRSSWRATPYPADGRVVLRVMPGPASAAHHVAGLDELRTGEYHVSARSDRQGIRLSGPPIAAPPRSGLLLSFGVVWGAVQLPPDGEPIILLADHQTIGGYPVAAVVASADRPLLGQLGAGDVVRFELVTHALAQESLRQARGTFGATSG